jgi:hypothetical protein
VKGKGICFRRVRSENHTHGAAQQPSPNPKKVKKQKKKNRKNKMSKKGRKKVERLTPRNKTHIGGIAPAVPRAHQPVFPPAIVAI